MRRLREASVSSGWYKWARSVCPWPAFLLASVVGLACKPSPAPEENPARAGTSGEGSTVPGDSTPPVTNAAPNANARALLVAINDYKYDDDISDLRGTSNDMEAMRDVLIRRFGFDPAKILVLRDSQASKENILRIFRDHLTAKANADTPVVFAYSGHGSETFDVSGDEPKKYDQTLVSYDSARSGDRPNRDISDDEINGLLRELNEKTRHVTFIMDSCHSGTVTRATATPRVAKPDCRGCTGEACDKCKGAQQLSAARADLGDTPKLVQGGGYSGFRPGELSYVLISGAASQEFSYERVIDGRPMGALSFYLTRALWKAGPDDTYRDVMAQVAADVTSSLPAQHPQLEGSAIDTVLFGTRSLAPEAFLELGSEGSATVLQGGVVQGVSVGSQFAVYPPKTKNFEQAARIAELEVTEVGGVTAKVKVLSGATPLPVGARAVETHHQFDRVSLRVRVDRSVDSPVLGKIEEKLAKHSQIARVGKHDDYDMLVRFDKGQVEIERSTEVDRDKQRTTVAVPAGVDAAEHAVNTLQKWARWFSTRRVENDGADDLNVKFTADAKGNRVAAGTTINVTVNNQSPHKLYVSLFDLSSDGSITQVYPAPGAHEYIEPNTSWKKPMLTCVPKGKSVVHDVVKVFLTQAEHDLSFLEQPALVRSVAEAKGSKSQSLEDLLGVQALGTRGVLRPVPVVANSWVTRQLAFELEAKPGAEPCPAASN